MTREQQRIHRAIRKQQRKMLCPNGHSRDWPGASVLMGGKRKCGICHADRQREYMLLKPDYAQRRRRAVDKFYGQRRAFIDSYKLERGCMDCGYAAHPAALDFDHRPGEIKLFQLTAANRSMESLQAEIAKCDIVCANCHRIRTVNRRRGLFV